MDGFSVAAAGYLFNFALHTHEKMVRALNANLTNGQAAATLHFFNPADLYPFTPD